MRAITTIARAMLFSSAETLEIAIYLYDLYLYDYAFQIWVKLRQTVKLSETQRFVAFLSVFFVVFDFFVTPFSFLYYCRNRGTLM